MFSNLDGSDAFKDQLKHCLRILPHLNNTGPLAHVYLTPQHLVPSSFRVWVALGHLTFTPTSAGGFFVATFTKHNHKVAH
jgi:hypothetical protein